MHGIEMKFTVKTLLEKGYSQRQISKELNISRRTVKKYLSYIHKSINFIYQIKKKQRITYVSRDQSAEFHKRIYF